MIACAYAKYGRQQLAAGERTWKGGKPVDMFRVAVCGVITALFATQMKTLKEEYRVLILIASGVLTGFLVLDKMKYFADSLKAIEEYVSIDSVYIDCILRMIGITCISEFSAGLCRDSGHEALAEQISMLARLSILSFSVPIVLAVLESIRGLL